MIQNQKLKELIIFKIAFLEGFCTLAVEVITIRMATPIVGNNIIVTSVALGIILLALSYGYYRGGLIASDAGKESAAKKLFMNLGLAGVLYLLISFPLEDLLLWTLLRTTRMYLASVFATFALLFAFPVYIASQSIPILGELSGESHKTKVIGKILFYSTIGSFLGSILTSIVLFPLIGVSNTSIVTGGILIVASLLVWATFCRGKPTKPESATILLIVLAIASSATPVPKSGTFSFSSPYYNFRIDEIPADNTRLLRIDGSYSSSLDRTTKKSIFRYVREVVDLTDKVRPERILMIGGAGFTYPQEISKRDYVHDILVSDIDPNVYEIAETHFLQEKIDAKIRFDSLGARFLMNDIGMRGEKYDLVFVDAYSSFMSVPDSLLTKEFFDSLKRGSKGGIVINFILDGDLQSRFSKRVLATMESSFGEVYVKRLGKGNGITNILISDKDFGGYERAEAGNPGIYTDDRESIELDRYAMFKEGGGLYRLD